MNKKVVIAAAMSAAFAVPLAAQAQANVTVYGKLYPQINRYSVSGATAAGTGNSLSRATGAPDRSGLAMESSNSRLGFRGTEDLGGNLKALFQLEMRLNVDDGAVSSTSLWSRNTYVGMAGNFGSIKLGKMDTAYKNLGDQLDFLGISSGNFPGVTTALAYSGFGTNAASNFHLRPNNSIYYESPKFGGFQVHLDYALGEVPGSVSSGSLISAGVAYDVGPVYLALAHEIHNNYFGGSRNMPTAALQSIAGKTSKDKSTRLTAKYRFTSNTAVEVDVARTELTESGGAVGHFQNYKHNSWAVNAQHIIGPTMLQASYGAASAGTCALVGGVACTTNGLDGKEISVGAAYSLSKRTYLFAMATKTVNGDYATYSNVVSAAPAAPGADILQVAAGIAHRF